MKKKITLISVLVLCLGLLTGCFCRHEVWNEADCVTPRTCAECGETEGAPLGHVWMAATCEAPKTCEVCALTEGQPKGHSWVEATCAAPRNCTACGLTEGEALEHIWEEATTEAPKTCTLCALTEGERIITDPRFTTAATKDIQGLWVADITMTGDMAGLTGYTDPLADVQLYADFANDGTLTFSGSISDPEGLRNNLINLAVKLTYDQLANQGMDKDTVDAFLESEYGMNMTEYVASLFPEEAVDQLVEQFYDDVLTNGVYYIEDGKLYTGSSWTDKFTEEGYTFDGTTFVITSLSDVLGQDIVFTRAAE